MNKVEQGLKYLQATNPKCMDNNTECYIAFLEMVLEQWDRSLPDPVKFAMRRYPPETIVRKRRELVRSTKMQSAREQQYQNEYNGKPYIFNNLDL